MARPSSTGYLLVYSSRYGIVAKGAGGECTLQSWAGVGLGCESAEELVRIVKEKPWAVANWLAVVVLAIDDVRLRPQSLRFAITRFAFTYVRFVLKCILAVVSVFFSLGHLSAVLSTASCVCCIQISVLAVSLFDKLEYVARAVRGKDVFFGGICLIFNGDFLQPYPVDSVPIFL